MSPCCNRRSEEPANMGTNRRAGNDESFVQRTCSLVRTEFGQTDDTRQLHPMVKKHRRTTRTSGKPISSFIATDKLPESLSIDLIVNFSADTYVADGIRFAR